MKLLFIAHLVVGCAALSACLGPTEQKQQIGTNADLTEFSADGGQDDSEPATDTTAADGIAELSDTVALDATEAQPVDAAAPCTSDQACAELLKPATCQYARCLGTAGNPAVCQMLPVKDGTACGTPECLIEGGQPVLQGQLCKGGACEPVSTTTLCSDNDLCTTDLCNAISGCAHSFADCSDGNACTADGCTPKSGCTHLATDASPCDDGDACSSADQCDEDTCKAGPPKTCPSPEPCQSVNCTAATGACLKVPQADGIACDDGNSCTPKDSCKLGFCVGTGNVCDDSDPCTTDGCANGGCQHDPTSAGCDLDGSVCSADVCMAGACMPGKAQNCDDGNPCTGDSCDATKGCLHGALAFATPCSAGKWCGQNAQKGLCVAVVAVPTMTFVAGATVQLGCNAAVDPWCNPNEKPQHAVALSSFYVDTNEVTVSQYQACLQGGACSAPASGPQGTYGQPGKAQHPVNYVTWSQATTYCLWAGAGRLCSEAEWEYAARGGDGRRFPWGNAPATGCDLANWGGTCGGLQPVGQLPKGKSPFGVLDMAGNVREWVNDWYGGAAYVELANGVTPAANPSGPKTGVERVMRGGYFQDNAPELRTSARSFATPATSTFSLGIRCCRTPK